MNRRFFLSLLPLTLLGSLSGCGQSAKPPEKTPDLNDLKAQLEFVAKEGSTGSALMTLQTVLQSIQKSHPDLYAKLDEKFQTLWNSEDPEKNRKIAQEMLEIVNAEPAA